MLNLFLWATFEYTFGGIYHWTVVKVWYAQNHSAWRSWCFRVVPVIVCSSLSPLFDRPRFSIHCRLVWQLIAATEPIMRPDSLETWSVSSVHVSFKTISIATKCFGFRRYLTVPSTQRGKYIENSERLQSSILDGGENGTQPYPLLSPIIAWGPQTGSVTGSMQAASQVKIFMLFTLSSTDHFDQPLLG